MNYTLKVEEDPETKELVLTFPDELMEEMGWEIGDTLSWEIMEILDDEGISETISLKKVVEGEKQ